jgi:hypothetical protein
MKKRYAALLAGALMLCNAATALPIIHEGVVEPDDFPANDIDEVTGQPGLGVDNVFAFVQIAAEDEGFPAPTPFVTDYTGGPIAAGDYLVLHYGTGKGGTPGAGGGLVGFFDEAVDSFAVPQEGVGPNGFGDLSFARLYDHVGVPDGGTTAMLFGGGLIALGLIRRKFRS